MRLEVISYLRCPACFAHDIRTNPVAFREVRYGRNHPAIFFFLHINFSLRETDMASRDVRRNIATIVRRERERLSTFLLKTGMDGRTLPGAVTGTPALVNNHCGDRQFKEI